MSDPTSSDDRNDRDLGTKELRRKYASGWMDITKNNSVPYIVDALLDYSPKSEFNKTELAQKSGVSRESVRNHIDLLITYNIIEKVDGENHRYRLNSDGATVKKLFELNSALSAARATNPEPPTDPDLKMSLDLPFSERARRVDSDVTFEDIMDLPDILSNRNRLDA